MSTNNRDSNERGGSTRDFILGALIGGAAGALAALFLAPKSGRELRNELNQQANTLKEKSSQMTTTAMQKSSGIAEQAKSKTIHLSDSVSQQTTEFVSKVKELTKSTKGYIDEKRGQMVAASNNDVVTNEEIQRKLLETQKAFDDTESKLNQ